MGKQDANGVCPFKEVASCSADGREENTIVASLNGTLLRDSNAFAYYMLVAFEAGGYLRAVILLLAFPLAWLLSRFVSEAKGIELLIFVSLAGLKASRIQAVSRAVLPKFFCEDVHPEAWKVFSSFGKRLVLTSTPHIMVEVFAREYLRVDMIIGTELQIRSGRATGFLEKSGVLTGAAKTRALRDTFGLKTPHVGLGSRDSDHLFLELCEEGYVVPRKKVEAFPKEKLPKVVIFHDGRFVRSPRPMVALLTLLWMPFGFALAILRIVQGLLPFRISRFSIQLLGVTFICKGSPPPAASRDKSGVLFVLNHRTCLDPIFLAVSAYRPIPTLTYSISKFTEAIAPIKTVALERDREKDAQLIAKHLSVGDLSVCPEGTTCREPVLLRYSAMFAELTNDIVPVAVSTKQSMFYGNTANGWKGWDPFFFFMNPHPAYEIHFLNQLPPQLTRAGGKSSHEVANYIQRTIAGTLNFECTDFTRKDKYRMLTGNDGTVPSTVPGQAPLRSLIFR